MKTFLQVCAGGLIVLGAVPWATSGSAIGMPRPPLAPADGCTAAGPRGCLALAVDAMGGRAKLDGLQRVKYEFTANELIPEQSYRQDPFIAAYERATATLDYEGQRGLISARRIWPESDSPQFEFSSTLVVTAAGGVHRGSQGDGPATAPEVENTRFELALGPGRLLQTAGHASDLHFEPSETLRSTVHPVLAFRWNGTLVRILVNPFNQLPDAIELTSQPHDFWSVWGDVRRRFYLDNWVIFQGVVWPTNIIEERNGLLWRSAQVLTLETNPGIDEAVWTQDPRVVKPIDYFPALRLDTSKAMALAPGVTLIPGGWNTTLVEQPDTVDILEAPIGPTYVADTIAEAKRRYPTKAVGAVISTSDSWPHVAGVRGAVALDLPTYVLDLNQPLLDRLVRAPHTLAPDSLTEHPRTPRWRVVSGRVGIGSGDSRMELYPIRGASTERQIMVYWPAPRLLYASDTLALYPDGRLYDPELMREVMQAVAREHLDVATVFAMHEGPTPWSKVVGLVESALR